MNKPVAHPFQEPGAEPKPPFVPTPDQERHLEGLTPRDRARAIGRMRKAAQEESPAPAEITPPPAVTLDPLGQQVLAPDPGPLMDGQMLDGKAQYLLLPVARISPDPDQPRKTFRNVGELAGNMKKIGLLQPITVRLAPDSSALAPDTKYLLIYGERRWRAAKSLNWTHIGAIVRFGVKDTELLVQQLTENSMREDLDPIEEMRAIRAFMRHHRIATQLEAAIQLGHSLAWVSNRLALKDLDEHDQEAVARKEMPILVAAKKARERAGNTRSTRKEVREPHFGPNHKLAPMARSRCRAQSQVDGVSEHPHIVNSGACGLCWENVIRQDAVRQARFEGTMSA